ncbi:10120_t:CDS:2 [Funneliformis caledonium]|uniref:10120_t:CDS:1 n=1 Tax=Funneliformis caledonium TaxID=1117310 RepID=A0A9N9HV32_9GLOM|nr:10120_t:CDS:2 [Funneliformis caledonium]
MKSKKKVTNKLVEVWAENRNMKRFKDVGSSVGQLDQIGLIGLIKLDHWTYNSSNWTYSPSPGSRKGVCDTLNGITLQLKITSATSYAVDARKKSVGPTSIQRAYDSLNKNRQKRTQDKDKENVPPSKKKIRILEHEIVDLRKQPSDWTYSSSPVKNKGYNTEDNRLKWTLDGVVTGHIEFSTLLFLLEIKNEIGTGRCDSTTQKGLSNVRRWLKKSLGIFESKPNTGYDQCWLTGLKTIGLIIPVTGLIKVANTGYDR